MNEADELRAVLEGHNPYFSRWFSAIVMSAKLVMP